MKMYIMIILAGVFIMGGCSPSREKGQKPEKELSAQEKLIQADKYKKEGNFETAKEAYQQVIEENPESWVAYTELAGIYAQEEKFEEAKNLVLQALEYNQQNYIAWFILGGCYYELGDLEKAEQSFIQSMSIQASEDALRGLIGLVGGYVNREEYPKAENLLNNLLSLNPPEQVRDNLQTWLDRIEKLKGQ